MQAVEIWEDITGYEGFYQVSNMGRVRSVDRVISHSHSGYSTYKGRVKKTSFDTRGYPHASLTVNCVCKTFKIHRLVAQAFIPNPEKKETVNHKNGIKTDNRVDNLEWMTNTENMRHAHATGLKVGTKGSRHGMSKLTEADIPKIRILLNEGKTLEHIAKLFGVSNCPIYNIRKGKSWQHV